MKWTSISERRSKSGWIRPQAHSRCLAPGFHRSEYPGPPNTKRFSERCWLYCGHDSELQEPGSFLTRTVAGRDFIFNRDTHGKVNVFYNLCTHRGGRVCRESRVIAASVFQCFYHGWVFGSDGGLRVIPQEGAYPEGYKSKERGLVHVPRH